MAQLHYLTVQDILWINLQVTKKVQHFNYARLEEATYYQFAYGESSSLLPQAGRFLTGFLKMHPFDAGNEATAFIGCASFLELNGMNFKVAEADAIEWMDKVMTKQMSGVDAVTAASAACEDAHHGAFQQPPVRSTITAVLKRYPETIAALINRSSVAK